jgi:hypothetical protein
MATGNTKTNQYNYLDPTGVPVTFQFATEVANAGNPQATCLVWGSRSS